MTNLNKNVYKLDGFGNVKMYDIKSVSVEYDMFSDEPYNVLELSDGKTSMFVAENIVKEKYMNFEQFKVYSDEYVFVDDTWLDDLDDE